MNQTNNQSSAENWKDPSVTRQDVRRYITMRDRLLVQLPWFQTPIEIHMINAVNQGDHIKISGSMLGQQWVNRSQIEVLAILPPTPKPATRPGIKNTCNDQAPPWFEELENQ